jgi:hypothetical protein
MYFVFLSLFPSPDSKKSELLHHIEGGDFLLNSVKFGKCKGVIIAERL